MFESGLNYSGVFMFMHVIALCIIYVVPAKFAIRWEKSNVKIHDSNVVLHSQRFLILLIRQQVFEERQRERERDFAVYCLFIRKSSDRLSNRSNEQYLTRVYPFIWNMPIIWDFQGGLLDQWPPQITGNSSVVRLFIDFLHRKYDFAIKYYYNCWITY